MSCFSSIIQPWTLPGKIREDMCGFEEITHPPGEVEYRPTPPINPNATVPSPGSWETRMGSSQKILLAGKMQVQEWPHIRVNLGTCWSAYYT